MEEVPCNVRERTENIFRKSSGVKAELSVDIVDPLLIRGQSCSMIHAFTRVHGI